MPSVNAWLPLPLSYEACSRHRVGETPLVTHEPRQGVMGGSAFDNSSSFRSYQIATLLAGFTMGDCFNVPCIYPSIHDVYQLMGEVLNRWFGIGVVLSVHHHR